MSRLHGNIYDYYQDSDINAFDSCTERIDPTARKIPNHENQLVVHSVGRFISLS